MALTLTIRSGDAEAHPVTFDAPRIVLGRGESCDMLLPDPSVSQRHASIRQRGSEYIVLDEGSTNGTFVGPVKLSGGAPRVLKNGDLIRLGRIWVEVELAHAIATANPAQTTKEIALQLVASALQAEGAQHAHPEIVVLGGPDSGQTLVLSRFSIPYSIGRGKNCDLTLGDEDISRRHLEVTRRGLHIYVRELGSKNGATLGDSPLEANLETLWNKNRRLVVGQSTLELSDAVGDLLAEMDAAPDEIIETTVEPPNQGDEPHPAPLPKKGGATGRETRKKADVSSRAPASPSSMQHPPRSAKNSTSEHNSRRGWGPADVVVAVLGLLVLALSIAGLTWLLSNAQ